MCTDNRESEAYFATSTIPIGRKELLESLVTVETDASGETSYRAIEDSDLDAMVQLGDDINPRISYMDAFLLQMGEKLYAEDLLASLLTFNESLLCDEQIVNSTLVERVFDLILLLKGPRAEFLRILAAVCACGAPGGRKKVLSNQELLTKMLMLGNAGNMIPPRGSNDTRSSLRAPVLSEDLIFIKLTDSESRDKDAPNLPKEVYASWNCTTEFKIGNKEEASTQCLFYEPYSAKLFFREGLKELPSDSDATVTPQPGIEVVRSPRMRCSECVLLSRLHRYLLPRYGR